jgi:uncharacterized protein
MIDRIGETLIRRHLGSFPAVGIVGPRQCGKTTLAKSMGADYFDLEQEDERVRLDLMWSSLIKGNSLTILDEAQTWPAIFPRLRGAIDQRRSVNGRFLVLGSVSPVLMTQVSEALTGRIAQTELAPLTATEIPPAQLDQLWRGGGFPEPFLKKNTYPTWQQSYLSLLAKRDLPLWGLPAAPATTSRLFKLLAAVHGGQQNASELGATLGLSHHTIQAYLDFLEGAFLIRRLQPYYKNLAKRLVKTPKIYWRDSGLLHSLLGLSAKSPITSHSWIGESWEGWVIEQILSTRHARGQQTDAWYFRTADGLECDLVLECEGQRELIEIKLTTAPAMADLTKLRKIRELIGADRLVLLTRSEKTHVTGDTWMTDLPSYLEATKTLE